MLTYQLHSVWWYECLWSCFSRNVEWNPFNLWEVHARLQFHIFMCIRNEILWRKQYTIILTKLLLLRAKFGIKKINRRKTMRLPVHSSLIAKVGFAIFFECFSFQWNVFFFFFIKVYFCIYSVCSADPICLNHVFDIQSTHNSSPNIIGCTLL